MRSSVDHIALDDISTTLEDIETEPATTESKSEETQTELESKPQTDSSEQITE